MNPSDNLFLIGGTGAGKSAIGTFLATHYRLPFYELDQEIEHHLGQTATMIMQHRGETCFRQHEAALLEKFSRHHGIVLATGAGAVLDADNRRHLAERGFVVWLQTTPTQQAQRLRCDTSRPLLQGLSATERLECLQTMAKCRNPMYLEIADLTIPVSTDNLTQTRWRCMELVHTAWEQKHKV